MAATSPCSPPISSRESGSPEKMAALKSTTAKFMPAVEFTKSIASTSASIVTTPWITNWPSTSWSSLFPSMMIVLPNSASCDALTTRFWPAPSSTVFASPPSSAVSSEATPPRINTTDPSRTTTVISPVAVPEKTSVLTPSISCACAVNVTFCVVATSATSPCALETTVDSLAAFAAASSASTSARPLSFMAVSMTS